MATWRELIASSALPRGEARWLAAHAAGRDVAWLIAHDTDEVDATVLAGVRDCLSRRQGGEPVAYITGEREFYGLSLAVTPDVLIPRPETELLVELALERLPRAGRLLDVGTGSGAVAIAIAHQRPDAEVVACDISVAALAVAQANARRHGVKVQLLESDCMAAFDGRRFDVIASNPPYIAAGDPHLYQGDLRFEPSIALHCGPDGMTLIRRLAAQGIGYLESGGWLLFEHGYDQGEACVALLSSSGYFAVSDRPDLAGIGRVCLGRKP